MKGYLDAKELESYKKEDLQELAKQLGVDAEGTKKEIAARCAAVEVDIPDNSELTEEDKKVAAEAAAEAAAKAEEEKAAAEAAAKAEEEKKAAGLVKVKAQRRFLDKELNQIKDTGGRLHRKQRTCSSSERGRRSRSSRVRKRVRAMAAYTTTLTEKMRAALRISSTSEKITEEINDCIAACKADLKNDGVKVIKETDELIIRAITLYCKAEFGFNNNAEQFRKSYDALKMRLALSVEYNTAPEVSETDTDGAESEV